MLMVCKNNTLHKNKQNWKSYEKICVIKNNFQTAILCI